MGKKKLLLVLVLLAAGGGYYYWKTRMASTHPVSSAGSAPMAQKETRPTPVAPKQDLGHPRPGEMVSKDKSFFENDYGFSMVLPAWWRVISWSEPVAAEPGRRRSPYKIRLEDPKSASLLDFAVYPFTEKSRYAVEEVFISKIEPPVPGYELEIQLDEVVKQGEMRIRRAEMKTRDSLGTPGLMKTYYYLANDKLYTFSLLGSEQVFASQGSSLAKLLDDIRILG